MPEPNRKLGPYTLVSKIGLGGFGVVWLAEKRTAIATTKFALKLPRGEDIDLEAFKQEAAIWLQASGHPNVLPLIDADIYDDQIVIVSEYVSDGSLGGWLKQHGGKASSPEAAVEMMDGIRARPEPWNAATRPLSYATTEITIRSDQISDPKLTFCHSISNRLTPCQAYADRLTFCHEFLRKLTNIATKSL
jgi:serine/threonine protein kinase